MTSRPTTAAHLAQLLGYKGTSFVDGWLSGATLPRLATVVDLANALDLPLEDLLGPWLADQAPEHVTRFKVIAAQLMGREAADDLLSCAPAQEGANWLDVIAPPMTGVEVIVEMEPAPIGMYRDNR
jgi:hypothetical protein